MQYCYVVSCGVKLHVLLPLMHAACHNLLQFAGECCEKLKLKLKQRSDATCNERVAARQVARVYVQQASNLQRKLVARQVAEIRYCLY